MPPTPISVNGVLRLTVDVSSQAHFIDFWCQRTIADPLKISSYAGVGFDTTGDVVGQVIWDLLKAFYTAAVLAPAWTLLEYDSGTLIPLDSGMLTGVGTETDPLALACQLTLTFRSGNQVLDRLQIPEPAGITVPQKSSLAANSYAPVVALRDSYTDNPDGTTISSWICARDGSVVWRAIGLSADTNDKFRRMRGL